MLLKTLTRFGCYISVVPQNTHTLNSTMMPVPVEVDGRLNIKSWYKLDKDKGNVRKGILIYKKING